MCGDLGKSITSCKTSIFCYFVINKVLFLLNILLFSIVFSTVRLLDKGPDVIQTNWIYVYLILLRKKKKKKKREGGFYYKKSVCSLNDSFHVINNHTCSFNHLININMCV